MKHINLLDCTLRDGGYVNNWEFGLETMKCIIDGLEQSGVDIIELGFLRNETRTTGRSSFSDIGDVNQLIDKRIHPIYAVMIEAFNPYPLDKLTYRKTGGVNLIRVCIWKRCMAEHLAYCKTVADKGYMLSIQPSRVEQYNDFEFIEMLKYSNELHPYSVYVVDTWGTQSESSIGHYLELADKYLDEDIRIGYHGHNNKMQALGCAAKALTLGLHHDLCIDSSIMGMGRGAGNLNTELIMEYLNSEYGKSYDTNAIMDIFVNNIQKIYEVDPWGYSLYYFLSAVYGCNPNFATYFHEQKYGINVFRTFLASLSEQEKILFNEDFVENRMTSLF